MDSVYMNNFRGFSRTVLPIRPVNFLVGENSTGKSSFLALVELLSKPQFWFHVDFNAGNYQFGGYKDIVSVLSEDQTEFQIGVCKHNKEEPADNACCLLHFRKAKEGVPQLARYSLICPSYHGTVRLAEKQVAAWVSTDRPSCADCLSADDCFDFLQETPTRLTSGYRVMSDEESEFVRSAPVVGSSGILNMLLKNKVKGDRMRSFSFPLLTMSFAGMAPIRTTPKRTYDGYTKPFSPDGTHTPYVIRRQLPRVKKKSNAFKSALEKFGADSGLFEGVGVTRFGKDLASPFELTVTLGTKPLRVNSVGYGVSQVLPVVVELLTHGKDDWLAFQQPEVHLHPKAQAALGDVLFHAAIDESQTLLVETHSDYLLDRFRLSMRDHEHPADFTQVIFFERSADGNHVYPMLIDREGEYPKDQPPGFRKFFLAEQKQLLGL